jgi:hypothetical protein
MSKNMIFGFLYSRAGGVAQMIECLLSKCEALRSNPSTAKKKKKERKWKLCYLQESGWNLRSSCFGSTGV